MDHVILNNVYQCIILNSTLPPHVLRHKMIYSRLSTVNSCLFMMVGIGSLFFSISFYFSFFERFFLVYKFAQSHWYIKRFCNKTQIIHSKLFKLITEKGSNILAWPRTIVRANAGPTFSHTCATIGRRHRRYCHMSILWKSYPQL